MSLIRRGSSAYQFYATLDRFMECRRFRLTCGGSTAQEPVEAAAAAAGVGPDADPGRVGSAAQPAPTPALVDGIEASTVQVKTENEAPGDLKFSKSIPSSC